MLIKLFEWNELFDGFHVFHEHGAARTFLLTGSTGPRRRGLTALVYLLVKAFKGVGAPRRAVPVEIFGIYWGMVDAVWVFLFPSCICCEVDTVIDEAKVTAVYGILILRAHRRIAHHDLSGDFGMFPPPRSSRCGLQAVFIFLVTCMDATVPTVAVSRSSRS